MQNENKEICRFIFRDCKAFSWLADGLISNDPSAQLQNQAENLDLRLK